MTPILLSILTPAVPSRLPKLTELCAQVETQIGFAPVEHLVLLDNKKRTVGEKRDALLRAAKGRYVAFVDDDDGITPGYISEILNAVTANSAVDVVTFLQEATVNGTTALIEFKLGNPNEPFHAMPNWKDRPRPVVKRNAWHVCAWRRSLAMLSHFPPMNYGEDWAYASKLCAMPNLREVHIPKVLHYYRHDENLTEAPAPK